MSVQNIVLQGLSSGQTLASAGYGGALYVAPVTPAVSGPGRGVILKRIPATLLRLIRRFLETRLEANR